MPTDKKEEPHQCSGKLFDTAFRIENSDYYKIHLLEHQAIMDNKYFLSQKAGIEIPYEQAFWNFNFCHREKWFKSLIASGVV